MFELNDFVTDQDQIKHGHKKKGTQNQQMRRLIQCRDSTEMEEIASHGRTVARNQN